MSHSPCELCNDTKHVNENGAWKRCPKCYATTQADHRLRHIPAFMREVSMADIPQVCATPLTKSVERLSSGDFPRRFIIISSPKVKQDIVAAYISHVALAGKTAEIQSLQNLADAFFSNKELWNELSSAKFDVLLVTMGKELLNSASVGVISEIIQSRALKSAYTVIFCDVFVAQLPKELSTYLSSDMFKEVKVP